ncbi:MAG: 2-succinyl-5-enolpyruvyl-6-hydroxy-3-cyclohexene-carboxylic-acid synthase [Bacteroidota bacterium]|jgi:2-succinyl-5-enolpyruvyl-6-hydroxy-3-cyclohexene-1-carboxylate synthase
MISSNKIGVQVIVEQCLAHGMKHVVCSPGSRNAPFSIAFDEHPEIETYIIHDERSAAFFALGLAQQLNEPVGIVCTSGSAALNYYPAVAEAYYQCIPLVVITADRPAEWVDQGDGQTIVQREVYKNHIRYSCQFSEKVETSDERWYMERELAVAFSEGTTVWKGPIHINVALNEPLYGQAEIEKGEKRSIEIVRGTFHFSNRNSTECIKAMSLPKKMVICGQLQPDAVLLEELKRFANDSSVAILVENTSNLSDLRFVQCIDRTLNAISDEELANYAPDVLITIGGAVVSKKIKAFIRKFKPKYHWKVGFEFPYMDTYQSMTHSFQVEPSLFFHEMNQLNYDRSISNFGAKWKQTDFLVQEKMPAFFHKVPYSDVKVFEALLDYLPENSQLHMANSSVVRYCQLFDPIQSIKYWSNRGTSGIDGSTSTALGAAVATQNDCHVLITGDVSFFYDSNALWNAYLPANFRIILINNGGGGIFKIIPGPASTNQLNKYFEAQHSQDAKLLSEAFGVRYYSAESMEEIESLMLDFYTIEDGGKAKLLEIKTPGDSNHLQLDAFFQELK